MDSPRPKSARPVAVADHLWELFEQMAQSMGSDPDALINQAMFMFARANGFIGASPSGPAPGSGMSLAGSDGALRSTEFEAASRPERPLDPRALGGLPMATTDPIALMPEQVAFSPEEAEQSWAPDDVPSPVAPGVDDHAHRRVAERVLQTAAELERLIATESEPTPAAGRGFNGENGGAPHVEGQVQLFILGEDGHESGVTTERFVIGRGKHCDYVISSGKVSREHAAIVREGTEYFIEDLGSSNGTWFNKQRIKRRKIADGDEYFICSDKIRLVIR